MAKKTWLRRLFPAPFAHVPSEAELTEHRDRLTRSIVMQHAEGSVLLAEGKFKITGDLFAEDDQTGADTTWMPPRSTPNGRTTTSTTRHPVLH